MQGTQNKQNNREKQKQSKKTHAPQFQNFL